MANVEQFAVSRDRESASGRAAWASLPEEVLLARTGQSVLQAAGSIAGRPLGSSPQGGPGL
eukprot:scaffold322181_cov39-Tisochrysis_lutea.AAC.1